MYLFLFRILRPYRVKYVVKTSNDNITIEPHKLYARVRCGTSIKSSAKDLSTCFSFSHRQWQYKKNANKTNGFTKNNVNGLFAMFLYCHCLWEKKMSNTKCSDIFWSYLVQAQAYFSQTNEFALLSTVEWNYVFTLNHEIFYPTYSENYWTVFDERNKIGHTVKWYTETGSKMFFLWGSGEKIISFDRLQGRFLMFAFKAEPQLFNFLISIYYYLLLSYERASSQK